MFYNTLFRVLSRAILYPSVLFVLSLLSLGICHSHDVQVVVASCEAVDRCSIGCAKGGFIVRC